ncbi:M14 family metallopeptidase [Hwangdonia lutea]|uniref:M14 family metallopeptidase n=1 Tax=Hwangdonia lutea TaxID=3075823 RepID=A0AA97HQ88_9FLAO|nr:M14 family metallopeptidase [Hwangdonia sp. SCSIO 19198]WOD42448.1 M14 family metallopeptidase [Hwangdonia sp. SCSIO 19198]
MKHYFSCFLFLTFLVFTISLNSQNIKSPSQFLGYDLGTQFSRHHQVVDYFKQVSNQLPNQVKLETYGQTYERRPLMVAYVSSEENLQNLETIRQNNLKNIGVNDGAPIKTDIAIVWLSYNVHGNEASSSEAAMKTLYQLLTEKQDWLQNTVVIIDPCLNPDGRDRYVNWYNKTASTPYDINQQASEHNEPWPSGRPNHYLFDLNRDWAWATQIETASRLKIYNKWMPHIHVDFHEQGINEPYYFAPAAEPFHEIITNWQRDFQTQIGKNHATYFDKAGWLYFTKERFDLLYPSYGDTYPTYMGAIGMTYEQAGHGRAGLGIINDEGDVLTLIDRIDHHTTAGLSTVEIASKHAKKLNTEFQKFFDNSNLTYKSYVLQGHPDKIESLKNLLDKHEVSYGIAQGGKVSGYHYNTSSLGQINTTSKDLVVSTNQPKGKMVKVLFEPNTKLSDSMTYDITAWSLPYAYGLNAVASKNLVQSIPGKQVKVNNTLSKTATGYIAKWNHLKDAEFLADLLKQNIKVRFTEKPFKTVGETFNSGSLIMVRGDNEKATDFDNAILKTANKHNRKLTAAPTGFSTNGPDFGSPEIKIVNKQKIAMLSGKGTSSLHYGALWHFFERQLHYPVTSINTENFAGLNLSKFDVLIIPSGRYSRILNEKGLAKLKSWVAKGGKVIAIGNALNAFADKNGFNLKKKETDKVNEDNSKLIPYADRERDAIKNLISGAIFKTKVDNTHPMAFGYDTNYPSLKVSSNSYKLMGDKHFNVAYLGKNPNKISGFAGSNALKKLDNTLVFGEERIGKGSMIYMVDDVMFRSFWENGKLFLVNAIFFVNNNAVEL